MSLPVIPVTASTLVMPLVGALDSSRLQHLQDQSLNSLERTSARNLVLDVTGVPVVDSQVAHGLIAVVMSARLLGAEVMLVGVRPEVAQTIVGLGLELRDIRIFSDLQSALARLTG
jgi:rsbT co-antagonist protein RsbR